MLFVSALIFTITTCKSPTNQVNNNASSGDLEETSDGVTRLVVAIHDDPFKMEGRNVQELNITVEQIVIIDERDRHITILQEERQMELLAISMNDPVVLSNVPVEPGNVYMFETVSPNSGIDTTRHENYVMNFFQLNISAKAGKQISGNLHRMREVIKETNTVPKLNKEDVDAYIILVNHEPLRSYTFSYNYEVSSRNKQPAHAVIIQAPAGKDVTAPTFHNSVSTEAIAHELGHAMARLLDEYEEADRKHYYKEKYRNLSKEGDGDFKWQGLIELDNNYYDSSLTNPTPTTANKQKLANLAFPNYLNGLGKQNNYYIPTVNSLMRGESGSDNYQYGPVNTYHMEGSFRARIGDIKAQDPKYSNGKNYEWEGYSFKDFSAEWPYTSF